MFADVADKPGGASGPAGTAQRACATVSRLAGARDSSGMRKRGLRLNMANNPKKVKDPTEVALSAIQEALNISDTTADNGRHSLGGELSPPAGANYSETAFDSRGSGDRPVFDQIEEPRGARRAANDDRETIGQ